MVLQQGTTLNIRGTGTNGRTVTITFDGQTKNGTVDSNGQWAVLLDSMNKNATGQTMTISDGTDPDVVLTNILIGDVYLFWGQSNMELQKRLSSDTSMTEALSYSGIRCFGMDTQMSETELYQHNLNVHLDYDQQWRAPYDAFSAIALDTGVGIHKLDTTTPVGLIDMAVGATMIEHWMSLPDLDAEAGRKDTVQGVLDYWLANHASRIDDLYPDLATDLTGSFMHANQKWEDIIIAGSSHPDYADLDHYRDVVKLYKRVPAGLYNAMVAPLHDFKFKAVIGYQGESNDNSGDEYYDLAPVFISRLRTQFGQPDLPFVWCGLAYYQAEDTNADTNAQWALIRDAQLKTSEDDEHTHAIAIHDTGDVNDIHPVDKTQVISRLVNYLGWLLHGGQASGALFPKIAQVAFSGSIARMVFENVQAGLITSNQLSPHKFALSSDGTSWHWADTITINGNNLIEASSASVTSPVHVRYAWAKNPNVNTFSDGNAVDLPVLPFTTTNRPGLIVPAIDIQVNVQLSHDIDSFLRSADKSQAQQRLEVLSEGHTDAKITGFGTPRLILFNGAGHYKAKGTWPNYLKEGASIYLQVRPDDGRPTTTQTLLGAIDGAGIQVTFDLNTAGQIVVTFDDGTSSASITSAVFFSEGSLNSLTNLTFVFDSKGTGKLYLNGIPSGDAVDVSTLDWAAITTALQSTSLYVGARNNNSTADQFFTGAIGRLYITNARHDAPNVLQRVSGKASLPTAAEAVTSPLTNLYTTPANALSRDNEANAVSSLTAGGFTLSSEAGGADGGSYFLRLTGDGTYNRMFMDGVMLRASQAPAGAQIRVGFWVRRSADGIGGATIQMTYGFSQQGTGHTLTGITTQWQYYTHTFISPGGTDFTGIDFEGTISNGGYYDIDSLTFEVIGSVLDLLPPTAGYQIHDLASRGNHALLSNDGHHLTQQSERCLFFIDGLTADTWLGGSATQYIIPKGFRLVEHIYHNTNGASADYLNLGVTADGTEIKADMSIGGNEQAASTPDNPFVAETAAKPVQMNASGGNWGSTNINLTLVMERYNP